jgi:hypothetical protein
LELNAGASWRRSTAPKRAVRGAVPSKEPSILANYFPAPLELPFGRALGLLLPLREPEMRPDARYRCAVIQRTRRGC